MWFIGVEVEQETSVPPPKKHPGSAPVQTIILAPREVHRLVLKKTSKVKESKNKNRDQPELEAIFSCRLSVLSVGKFPGDGGCSQLEVQGVFLLRSTKLTGGVNMVRKK